MTIITRTRYAEHCHEQISLLESTYRLGTRELDTNELGHYSNYLARGIDLYNLGMFDEKGLLENDDWDADFNFRYDARSIRGTHGELIIHLARNQCAGGTRSRCCSGSKAEELAGWDGEVYNTEKDWSKIYFQSKLLNTSEDGSLIKIYHNYLKPSYTAHRLALPSIERRMFMEMCLQWVRELVLDDPDPEWIASSYAEGDKAVSWLRRDYLVANRKKLDFNEYYFK